MDEVRDGSAIRPALARAATSPGPALPHCVRDGGFFMPSRPFCMPGKTLAHRLPIKYNNGNMNRLVAFVQPSFIPCHPMAASAFDAALFILLRLNRDHKKVQA
ncbi:MAG: hypothetical protein LUE17_03410 [Planctomycetaceae bacterium]|nr:hypothetical protein [Planctomycetaceae bacterium]